MKSVESKESLMWTDVMTKEVTCQSPVFSSLAIILHIPNGKLLDNKYLL